MLEVLKIVFIISILIFIFLICIASCVLNSRIDNDIEDKLVKNNKELEKMLLDLTKEVERLEKENKELRK